MNVDSGQNPWAQEFYQNYWKDDGPPEGLVRDDDWGAANAACERIPRFGPVPGETPAEAIVRKERNRETKKRGGKHKSFFYHRYGKGKGGKGSGDGGGGSSGSSGAQVWG